MADLRVFVSSTCYDLGVVREQLRGFIIDLGHQPVMSEYSDVLYDPKDHTHKSCVQAICDSDMVILIIGGRFGGTAIPEAQLEIDLARLTSESGARGFDPAGRISITQLEALQAFHESIPVFVFVDARVLHDHEVYENNKSLPNACNIVYPSIAKQETAKFIFEFINYLRLRFRGNAIQAFSGLEDMTGHLRRQWSGLLQRLLAERADLARQEKTNSALLEQIESLRAAVLASMQTASAREIARGVIRFRKAVDFAASVAPERAPALVRSGATFEQVLQASAIVAAKEVRRTTPYHRTSLVFVTRLGEFLETRSDIRFFAGLPALWSDFCQQSEQIRVAIFDAWTESGRSAAPLLRPIAPDSVASSATVRDLSLQDVFSYLGDLSPEDLLSRS